MSVVVAIKENGIVYMGADTQTTLGKIREIGLNETAFKIVRLANGMLVGFCGGVAVKQQLLAIKNLFTLDENGELTKRHIVNEIVPKLADRAEEQKDEKNKVLDVSITLAYKDKLYRIFDELEVLNVNTYTSAGAGAMFVDYAVCSNQALSAKERILSALAESAKRTQSVGGPYLLIDTKDRVYEIVDSGGNIVDYSH